MKNIITHFIFFLLLSACNKSKIKPKIEEPPKKTCFIVTDYDTGYKVPDVLVQSEIRCNYGIYGAKSGTTNSEGSCCGFEEYTSVSFSKDGYITDTYASHKGFTDPRLQQYATLKIKLKNIAPCASSDRLFINHERKTFQYNGEYFEQQHFDGIVDTMITILVDPRIGHIELFINNSPKILKTYSAKGGQKEDFLIEY